MKCPDSTCQSYARVLHTRQRKDGQTYRRYECANLHRFTTYETHSQNPPLRLKRTAP